MPVGTIDTSESERRELKSLPGAYIRVRPLPYGMKLERRDKATRMFMESEGAPAKGNRKNNNASKETTRLELETLNKWSAFYDFQYCIVEHNITDTNERVLDFTKRMDFESLSPKIGSEIERILDEINNEDEDFDEEDFTRLPSSSSITKLETSEDQNLEN